MPGLQSGSFRTVDVARATGYSVQQIRDLERSGVLPAARRSPAGFRAYDERHVVAARAYRALAHAVGPASARGLLASLRDATLADAAAAIGDAHARLARERDEVRRAEEAIREIGAESGSPAGPQHVMTIGELAAALGVRASALRHWEAEGLLAPERIGSLGARRYGTEAIREARIVAALRSAGHRVPSVRSIIDSLRRVADTGEAELVLARRRDDIAHRAVALLRAGAELATVIDTR